MRHDKKCMYNNIPRDFYCHNFFRLLRPGHALSVFQKLQVMDAHLRHLIRKKVTAIRTPTAGIEGDHKIQEILKEVGSYMKLQVGPSYCNSTLTILVTVILVYSMEFKRRFQIFTLLKQ